MEVPDQALLFRCHFTSDAIWREFAGLSSDLEGMATTYMVYHAGVKKAERPFPDCRSYHFTSADLLTLGYPMIGPSLVPGHAYFPLFLFARDHPEFEYYWSIEYDVRFSGDWAVFFDAFNKIEADFLAAHFHYHDEEPCWGWWSLRHPMKSIPDSAKIRCFMPVYRISKRALQFLHESLSDGWCGHGEVLIPTLLQENRFTLVDFGGNGRFVLPGMENRFYTSVQSSRSGDLRCGTLRCRPPFWRVGRRRNSLYHPVKPLPWTIQRNMIFYLGELKRSIWNRRIIDYCRLCSI